MSERRMCKKPVIVSGGSVKTLSRIPVSGATLRESWLQEILEKEPGILPTAHIDPVYAPLICVAREVAVGGNSIDILYISSKGYLVVVETKLWRNPESKRKVISQVIDYAKDLKDWDYSRLDSLYKASHQGQSLFSAMVGEKYLQEDDQAYFADIVENNIRKARFLLMIVGDGIREDVEKMTEFINSSVQMQYQFALCELEIYQLEDGSRLIVPQLTTKTRILTRVLYETSPARSPQAETAEETAPFLSAGSKAVRRRYRDIDDWADNTRLKGVSREDMIGFANDMEDLGFTMNPGTADFSIDYKSERFQKKCKCLMLFHDGENAGIQPNRFYEFLQQTDYSRAIADRLLETLKEHLVPGDRSRAYARPEGYYCIALERLIAHRDDIIAAFEAFIRSL